ncbi:MAG: hypothetical protein KY455_00825 [Euryarchaeota archaeon]|nr:hypothetical protein [Euryarchaeota archaeon]
MALDKGTEKKMRKEIGRLEKKKEKVAVKLDALEAKAKKGKIDVGKFQAKKIELVQRSRAYDMSMRKRQGSLGKAVASRR